ncbi:hypothetical protein FACS189413_05120 [Bacteroidia bacterium]|nr:hypothetical protein FACS189413_05120 [Bacteroidia bacterium]
MKRFSILTIAILATILAFAEKGGFRNRTDNWLKSNSSETNGGLRAAGDPGWIDGGTDNNANESGYAADPAVQKAEPIGSGLAVLVLSGAGYAFAKRRRK